MEKLIQDKAKTNKKVSAFINDLIHAKKLMNGWPGKFYKERGKLSLPIPADLATIIGSLAGDFQEIVSECNAIVQEQIDFSKNRRQRKPKQLNLPLQQPQQQAPTPEQAPAPDLSQQLSLGLKASDIFEGYLIKEASNPLTRFFHRLLSPGIGLSSEAARIRKYRLSLLNAALQIYKGLKKVQATIVKSGPQSIFEATQLWNKIEDSMTFLVSGVQAFNDTLPQGVSDAGGKIAPREGKVPQKPKIDVMKDPNVIQTPPIIKDIRRYLTIMPEIGPLFQLAMNFTVAPADEKIALATELVAAYQRVLHEVSAKNNIPPQKSFKDIYAVLHPSPSDAPKPASIQAVAQNIVGKWMHRLSPFDKTSAFRLDIYANAKIARKIADKIMDHLEEKLEAEELLKLIDELNTEIAKIRGMLQALNATIKGMGYQPQFMTMLEKGSLGEHDVDLDTKSKERLQKMLREKQLRDITKMYSRK